MKVDFVSKCFVMQLKEPVRKSQYVFKIVGDSKKHDTLMFNCQNDNERREWIVAVQQLTTNK